MRNTGLILIIQICISILCMATNLSFATEYGAGSPVDGGGDIVNTGIISARETADDAEAYGVWANDVGSGLNTGAILSEAYGWNSAYATGVFLTNAAGDILNEGTVLSFGQFETVSSSATGQAIGMYVDNVPGLTNSGLVMTVISAPQVETPIFPDSYGILAENSGDISNTGSIISMANSGYFSNAYGLASHGSGNVSNHGDIIVSALGYAYTWGYAYGIEATNAGDVLNTGKITAVSSTDSRSQAYGIVAEACRSVINAGTIDVLATSDFTYDGFGPVYACGIYAEGAGPVINTGSITATALGEDGFAAGIYGGYTDEPGTLTNAGTITVDGYDGAGIGAAYGDWTVFNTGYIFTSGGTRTLEVYEGSATLADSFRIIFNSDPASTPAPILVATGASTLNLDGAILLAQAGDAVAWNSPYQVIENHGAVNGEFSGLDSPNPDIAVAWTGDDNGENAAVSFRYAPQGTSAGAALRLAHLGALRSKAFIRDHTFSELLARHFRKQEVLLADSGRFATDSGALLARPEGEGFNTIFIRPYVETFKRPSDGGMGYDADLFGISLAYETLVYPKFILGGHAGIAHGSIDFSGDGYDAGNEEQNLYSLGVHGAWNPNGLHFGGSATLYAATHEYEGRTGGSLNLRAEDDYTSYGAEIEGIGGVIGAMGDWTVMPYAGFGFSWINSPRHTSEADGAAWDTRYGTVDEHILRLLFGAQLRTVWVLDDIRIIPSLGLRWEYALTDNDISVPQSLPGSATVRVEDDLSRSTVIGDASVTFIKGRNALEMGVMRQFNHTMDSGGAWLNMSSAF